MMLSAVRPRGVWLIAAFLVVAVQIVDAQDGFAQSWAELITLAIAVSALMYGLAIWLSRNWDFPPTFSFEFLDGSYPPPAKTPGQHAKALHLGTVTFLIRVRVRDPILMGEINLRFLNDDLTNAPMDAISISALTEEKVKAAGYDTVVNKRPDGHGGLTIYMPDAPLAGWPKGGGEDVFLTVVCETKRAWKGKLSFRSYGADKKRHHARRKIAVLA